MNRFLFILQIINFRPLRTLSLIQFLLRNYPQPTIKANRSPNIHILVNAGTNKQHLPTRNTAKLDRETEELKHKNIDNNVARYIQQGRQAKGLSQKDLATKINEKPQIVNDYEAGR